MVIGAPLEVPADADAEAVELKRVELEQRLVALQQRALELLSAGSGSRTPQRSADRR
jgi:hypothetical protein